MWYGIMLAAGMAAAVLLAYGRAPGLGLDGDRAVDLALYCIPAGVLGARLYYVAFRWSFYAQRLPEIFNLRSGGLAIHGGLLAAVGLGLYLARRWKLDIPAYLDLAAPSLALGQAIGRWGNFFNSEAHGGPTSLPWAVIVDGQAVHPTFLYESIWCLGLCLFLIRYESRGRKAYDGQLFLIYAALYSLERFFVEGLRTDSLMLGPLRAAQVFSLAAGLLASILLYRLGKGRK